MYECPYCGCVNDMEINKCNYCDQYELDEEEHESLLTAEDDEKQKAEFKLLFNFADSSEELPGWWKE